MRARSFVATVLFAWGFCLCALPLHGAEAPAPSADAHAKAKPADPLETWWAAARNRIEKALEKQGRSDEALESPKWFEQPYNTVGRMPLVDLALARPLLLPGIAAYAERETRAAGGNLQALLRLARELSDGVRRSAEPWSVTKLLEAGAAPADLGAVEEALADCPGLADFPAELRNAVFLLAATAGVASELREKALSGLDENGRARLETLLPAYFVRRTPGGEVVRGYTCEIDQCVELVALLGDVDFASLVLAARLTAGGLENFRAALAGLPPSAVPPGGVFFEHEASFGRIVLSGSGDDVHESDAALLVDFGGDDVHRHAAGATAPAGPGCALCIDVSGDDRYLAAGRAQGCAMAGVAALVDLAGDDAYLSGHYSQGAALCGFAFFLDGAGDDTYAGGLGVQGFSVFGASVFFEGGGRDSYRGAALCQGCASTQGVTVFAEAGGDDTWRAGGHYGFYEGWDSSCAQGAASGMRPWPTHGKITVCGGVGFLCEMAGNDTYHAYNIGQGGSYIFSLGMLVDAAGDDTYTGKNYTRGAGVHLSAGVCIDRAGDDLHLGDYGQNGMSLDRSAGVFVDLAGDDLYRLKAGLGYATKPRGCAIFLDAAGADVYAGGAQALGHCNPPYGEDAECTAVFLDFGGRDAYATGAAGGGNDASWTSRLFGSGEDVEASPRQGGEAPGWAPVDPWSGPDGDDPALRDCLSSITQVRFAAWRRVEREGLDRQARIATAVAAGGERSARAELVDHYRIRFLQHGPASVRPDEIRALLASEDRALRLLGLHLLSRTKSKDPGVLEAARALVLADPSPDVRSLACAALGETGDPSAVPILREALLSPSWPVRRRAALALGTLKAKEALPDLLSRATSDPEGSVRGRALEAIGEIGDPSAVEVLEKALFDDAPVARFFAARSLVKDFGRAGAMEHLFPLARWDNPHLRAQLLDRFLRDFTGVERPMKEEAWRSWWAEARGSFDAGRQARIYALVGQAESAAREGREEDALVAYRKIRAVQAGHAGACAETGRILNGRAWKIAVSGVNLAEGLAMARESVEAKATPDNLDTLAVLLYLTGEKEEAIMTLVKAMNAHPGHAAELFKRRLEEFKSGRLQLR